MDLVDKRLRVSMLPKFTLSSELQFMNMLLMYFTFLVLRPLRSISLSDEQSENMYCISVTSLSFRLPVPINDVRFLQPENQAYTVVGWKRAKLGSNITVVISSLYASHGAFFIWPVRICSSPLQAAWGCSARNCEASASLTTLNLRVWLDAS